MKEYANPIMDALTKQGVDTITSMKLSDMITSPKMSFETLTSVVNNPSGPLSSEVRVIVDKATKSMEVAKQIQDNQLNK